MNGEGDSQQNSRQPEATIEHRNDGGKNRGRRQGAGMKILIGEGRWRCRAGEGSATTATVVTAAHCVRKLDEASAADPPRTVEKQKDGSDLPQPVQSTPKADG